MERLSRSQVGHLIRSEASGLVVGTALLFCAAGSFWSHFAMHDVFTTPVVMGVWILIHGMSFLALRFRRLDRAFALGGFMALQLYFYATLYNYRIPFLPTAPVFFLVSTVVLTGFVRGRVNNVLATWCCCWLSTVFWVRNALDTGSYLNLAVGVAIAVNALFIFGFMAVSRVYAMRMARHIEMLGPLAQYDDYRIQASKMQMLGELTASVSHEILNPLAAIKGFSHQIHGELNESQRPSFEILGQCNERIRFNVDRIDQITRALRLFARDSSKDEFVPVSLRDVIEDSLMLLRHSIKESGVELSLEWPPEDYFVSGSLVQLSQTLVNLLSNARDACGASERKKVTIGYDAENGKVRLWVEDTGPGIPDAIARDVFRPFFTTKAVGKGTGLGLHISKTIAERHNGLLEFRTKRDQTGRVIGTRFVLTLPRLAEDASTGSDAPPSAVA